MRLASPLPQLLSALAALFVGGAIYLLWRAPTLWMFAWIDAVGGGCALDAARGAVACVTLPGWVLGSLPDALWQYALCVSFFVAWRGVRGAEAAVWRALPVVLGVGSELAQAARVLPGTFDSVDLAALLIAVLAAACVVHARPRLAVLQGAPA